MEYLVEILYFINSYIPIIDIRPSCFYYYIMDKMYLNVCQIPVGKHTGVFPDIVTDPALALNAAIGLIKNRKQEEPGSQKL